MLWNFMSNIMLWKCASLLATHNMVISTISPKVKVAIYTSTASIFDNRYLKIIVVLNLTYRLVSTCMKLRLYHESHSY